MTQPDAHRIYVFDATALIELERQDLLSLLTALGDRVCVPTPVKTEVNRPGTHLEKWLRENPRAVKRFVPGSREEELYYDLTLTSGPALGAGEAAAIAIASHRGGVLVTDDQAARRVAAELSVNCIGIAAFLGTPML